MILSVGKKIILDIEKIVYGGRGLARYEDFVIFIPGVIEGERIEAEITKVFKNYAEGIPLKLIKVSDFRIDPPCPIISGYFGGKFISGCPGCAYQHIDYREELRIKHQQLLNFIHRDAGFPGTDVLISEDSTDFYGYRNKLELHLSAGSGKRHLGYFGEDNKTIIDCKKCLLATENINTRLEKFRADKDNWKRYAGKTVTFRDFGTGETTCWARGETQVHDLYIIKNYLGEIRIPAGSFFQVNSNIADKLLKEVNTFIKKDKPEVVLDFYCGVGLFAFVAAKAGVDIVIGVDSDKTAIKAAKENSNELGYMNVRFRSQKSEEAAEKILKQHKNKNTLMILDPPRAGLAKSMVSSIELSPPKKIIYISCAADKLARDLKVLKKIGYNPSYVKMFDMFPRTSQFETLCILQHAG
ncbi:MAG: class I SAM-dependent RNA methyltransferase [Acidobacteria bacterium]|nr:class I SAM-dependent RNA methyltransferase [Acidobacteriota bacterium]